jgi:hypothetical protein
MFKQFANAENKMLLWHGSRLCSWTGILSHGKSCYLKPSILLLTSLTISVHSSFFIPFYLLMLGSLFSFCTILCIYGNIDVHQQKDDPSFHVSGFWYELSCLYQKKFVMSLRHWAKKNMTWTHDLMITRQQLYYCARALLPVCATLIKFWSN